ncbi:MAG TPA: LPS export ABC transporter periplasmic protein LptC [Deltaproteobacteria bacterium]|nr:MAG: LPS export ABC transporter periplasmic protein LptC [Deltaproteobacteria bacterium GWA2_55_82]OGQ62219.1 MAG: LPS export ABC transporter periplasmic protein LptC [Deltaproteobacteria bacterium RIFCSPLOWO2_02_FULL_55_12]OIJ73261.1 MAG: LPS export ABC transporter periplasmic protein LptC [Deltaproteobacteria bacterium GWC2_55_46]HBG45475.1 LPS export ABC transporter periplasmic protein LptC [Deltaproteobacteria bacterium]HCY10306.1 LPS export ABC transporter periplasmic protein LptC [Delt
MKRKIRVSLSAFIILSIVGLALLVFIHYKTMELPRAEFKEDEKVQVKIDRIRYSGTKDGRVEWELEADSARRSREEDLTSFDNVKVTFFSKDGTPYTLSALHGSFRENAGDIEVSGDVLVRSPKDDYSLKTGSLRYAINTKQMSTADRVFITSDRLDAQGDGLTARIDSGEFRLLRNVKAVFKGSAVR